VWGRLLAGSATLIGCIGCHSAFVQTTIENREATPVRTVELDYPSQSFGTQQIASGKVFHYRFKVQGSGPVKLSFMDAAGKTHSSVGPSLGEGEEGAIAVIIHPQGDIQWMPNLRKAK